MADDDEIRQRVIIEGTAGALAELEKLGDEGAAAIDKIKAAGAGDFGKGLRALSPELSRMVNQFADAEIAAAKISPAVTKAGVSLKGLRAAGRQANTKEIATDLTETAAAAGALDLSARNLSRTFRGLGRVTQIPALTILGRTFRGVAANAALISGPAIVAGLALIANSAAQATQPFQDLAFAAGQLPTIFQAAASAAISVGGDAAKFGEALSKIPQAIKATADQERGLKTASDAVRSAIDKGSQAYVTQLDALKNLNQSYQTFRLQIALGLDPVSGLNESLQELNQSYKDGKVTKEAYEKQSTKLNSQLILAQRQQRIEQEQLQKSIRDANQALVDQAVAEREAVAAARNSKRALEESANAYVKLGISAAQLKQLKPEEVLTLLTQKLGPMQRGFERNQIAIEILGENARKFITELDKGTGSMAAFIAEGQRIAPAFTPAQNAIGDQFVTAVGKLFASLSSIKDAFGLIIAPTFVPAINKVTDAFVAARPGIEAFATALGTVLKPIMDGLAVFLVDILFPAIALVSQGFSALAGLLNSIFGTTTTGADLFKAALFALLAAFFPIIATIILVLLTLGKLKTFFETFTFDQFKQKVAEVVESVKTFFVDLWNGVVGIFATGLANVKALFDATIATLITGPWEAFKTYLQGWVDKVVAFFKPLIDRINKISAFFGGQQSLSQDAGVGSFAGGGSVKGRGTGTSDDILAWLSNNEYVVRARAVAKYGIGFLNAINQGKLDLSDLMGYKLGGLVRAMSPQMGQFNIPAFAGGGLNAPNAGLKPVHINFLGETFEAQMTDASLDKLSKRSIRARAGRAGRNPSWVGS